MKNFSKNIEKKNIEIQKIFKVSNRFVLFGFNQIATYLLEKEISKICVVDKELIHHFSKKNIIKNIKFKTIDKISHESIIVNCVTGIKP